MWSSSNPAYLNEPPLDLFTNHHRFTVCVQLIDIIPVCGQSSMVHARTGCMHSRSWVPYKSKELDNNHQSRKALYLAGIVVGMVDGVMSEHLLTRQCSRSLL